MKLFFLRMEMSVVYVCNYSPPGNVIFQGSDGVKPLPAYEVVYPNPILNSNFNSTKRDFR